MKEHKTWYGDPDDDYKDLMYESSVTKRDEERPNGPEEGDELCDGHQMHYEWKDGKWQ